MGRRKQEVIKILKKFKQKISNKYDVDRFILFGSYAKGKQHKYSDIDILIVSKDFEKIDPLDRAGYLFLLWEFDIDVDFLCYSPLEFRSFSEYPTITRTAMKEGVEI